MLIKTNLTLEEIALLKELHHRLLKEAQKDFEEDDSNENFTNMMNEFERFDYFVKLFHDLEMKELLKESEMLDKREKELNE